MVPVVTERDFMSNMQRTDTRTLYTLVGIDMRTNALTGLARLGLPAVIIAICDHYESLFAARPSSIKVTRYSKDVKLIQKKWKNLLLIVAVFWYAICVVSLQQQFAFYKFKLLIVV